MNDFARFLFFELQDHERPHQSSSFSERREDLDAEQRSWVDSISSQDKKIDDTRAEISNL